MNLFTPFYLISARNEKFQLLARRLRHEGFAIAECTGCYKGKDERSILVIDETPSSPSTERALLRLARLHGQESILAADAARVARLIYVDKWIKDESLGRFVQVDEDTAREHDAWTERGGHFHICVPL